MYFNIFGDSFLTCSSKIHTDNELVSKALESNDLKETLNHWIAAPKAVQKHDPTKDEDSSHNWIFSILSKYINYSEKGDARKT